MKLVIKLFKKINKVTKNDIIELVNLIKLTLDLRIEFTCKELINEISKAHHR